MFHKQCSIKLQDFFIFYFFEWSLVRSHEISHRQIVTCPICSPLSVTYLFTGNTCGPRKGSGYPLPSSLSRTPQFGYTFSSSTHTHTPLITNPSRKMIRLLLLTKKSVWKAAVTELCVRREARNGALPSSSTASQSQTFLEKKGARGDFSRGDARRVSKVWI